MQQSLKWFLCMILLVSSHTVFSQNALIEFVSEEDTQIILYKPIDGGYNSNYPTDTIELKKGASCLYPIKVKDYMEVRCEFPNKMTLNLFIENNDTVRVICSAKQGEIRFEGNNAVSNDYLYLYKYIKEFQLKNSADTIFATKNFKLIDDIFANPRDLIRTYGMIEKIDSMYTNKLITPTCYNFLNKDLDYIVQFRLLMILDKNMNQSVINDSIYNHYKNKILDNLYINNNNIHSSYEYIFVSDFYNHLYEQLSSEIKECLMAKYGKETFGPYVPFLLAPEKIQLNKLFNALRADYKYKNKSFNHFKMFEYLNNKYPQSESVQILRSFVEEEARDTVPIRTTFLDNASIHSFSDIQKLEPFKGKYLFVDIWASWCTPCRSEFFYNKNLDALLDQYPNVEKLYISIDNKEDDWKKTIESMRLSGYHLQTTDSLENYLRKEIYQSNRITVPRYILIDKKGRILNGNLSRPSDIEKLKDELNKYLK